MTEYFKRYRSFVASCLEDKDCDFAKLLDYHKEHIAFFQHERLIHLTIYHSDKFKQKMQEYDVNIGVLTVPIEIAQQITDSMVEEMCIRDRTKADMEQIAAGIQLDDGEIHADAISYTDDFKKDDVGIEIHSGKMCIRDRSLLRRALLRACARRYRPGAAARCHRVRGWTDS